jgi:hypothetical protein
MNIEGIPVAERLIDKAWSTYLINSSIVRAKLLHVLGLTQFLDEAGGRIQRAQVSAKEALGETDVLAEWETVSGERLVVLIEDKLNASFQPLQGARYKARAEHLRCSKVATVRTVLVAPDAYLNGANPEARHFDKQISLETVLDWMTEAEKEHLAPELELAREALRRVAAGLALGAKGLHLDLHQAVAEECERRGNGLRITNNATDWMFFDHISVRRVLKFGIESRTRPPSSRSRRHLVATSVGWSANAQKYLPLAHPEKALSFEVRLRQSRSG